LVHVIGGGRSLTRAFQNYNFLKKTTCPILISLPRTMGATMSDVSDREKFEFDREKWRADLEMRGREVAVKEHEQASSKWRSPLVVAILAAAGAAFGNGIVAVVNGTQQVSLENSKAESTRILEMIKTGNSEAAARNLDFLLRSGLITDPDRVEKVTAFLRDRAPGAGPSLPAPNGRVAFEPSEALSEGLKQNLDKLMQDYIANLDKLGFPAGERVRVKIETTPNNPNAYYVDNMIVIDPKLAADRSVPLREYNHHVLTFKHKEAWEGHYAAIESGMADYLACSYLNNPKFGEQAAKAFGLQEPFLRNLVNDQNFADFKNKADKAGRSNMPYDGAKVWGGALWEIRTALGRDVADPIVATAWLATTWPSADTVRPLAFTTALLASAKQKAPAKADAIKAILQNRKFPLPS
jgi:hypothetical protein